jgi:hypothetical protein
MADNISVVGKVEKNATIDEHAGIHSGTVEDLEARALTEVDAESRWNSVVDDSLCAGTLNIHRIKIAPLPQDANVGKSPETSAEAPSYPVAADDVVAAVMTPRAMSATAGDVVVAEQQIEVAVVAGIPTPRAMSATAGDVVVAEQQIEVAVVADDTGMPATTTAPNAPAGSIVVESPLPADLSRDYSDDHATTAGRLLPVVEFNTSVPPLAAIGAAAVAEPKTGTGVVASSSTTKPKDAASSSFLSSTSSDDGFESSRLMI